MLAEDENKSHREKWERQVEREAAEMDLFIRLEQEIMTVAGKDSIDILGLGHKDIANDFADYSEANYLDEDLVLSYGSDNYESLADINETVANIDLNNVNVKLLNDTFIDMTEEKIAYEDRIDHSQFEDHGHPNDSDNLKSDHQHVVLDLDVTDDKKACINQSTTADLVNMDRYHDIITMANDLQVKNNILKSENQLVLERLKTLESALFQKDKQATVINQENENLKKMIKSYKKQIKASEILPTRKYTECLILGNGLRLNC
jgi:hypothetical protein